MFEDLTHPPTYTNFSLILPNAIHCLFEIYRNELKHNNQQSKTKKQMRTTIKKCNT
jgi:hypothetical protein